VKKALLILFAIAFNFASFSGTGDKGKVATKSVAGKVTDTNGEALPGTKIVVKETGETFFANLEGNFSFTLKTDKIYSLSVETVGYAPKELKSSELTFFSELTLTSR
jgi:hypothetical protein